MYNKITIIGNLGADPELKQTNAGTPVAKLNVATSENYKDKNDEWQTDTTWHSVIAWRKLAEHISRFSKGDQVLVEGKMSYRNWEDKEGNKRTSPEIVATSIRMMKKRQDENTSTPYTPAKNEAVEADDDLPF